MTPTTTSQFNLNTLKLRVTDTFDYGTIIYSSAYGNVTAKIGNSVFHTNTQFNANADIVIGDNTFIDIDLPTSNSLIREGSYTVIYNLLVNYVADALPPGATTFSSIAITPSSAQFIAQVDELLTQFDTVTIQFGSTSLGANVGSSTITGTSGSSTILFNQVTIAEFADIDVITITVTYTESNDYSFTNCDAVKGALTVTPNCAFATITVQDTTSYPAYVESLTREITLRYPKLASGAEVESPVTTSEASLTVGPYIWSGGYTISLSSIMSWEQEDNLLIQQTLTVYGYPNVQCDAGLCKAAKCIESVAVKYMAAVKNGSPSSAQLFQENFITMLYYMRYSVAISCGNTTLAAAILTEMITYLNMGDCTCGCGDTGSSTGNTEPTRIYPLFSSTALINGIENALNYQ